MAVLRIEKVDGSLPGTLSPNTMYLVKSGSTMSIHVTDSTGTTAYASSAEATAVEQIHPFLLMGVGNA